MRRRSCSSDGAKCMGAGRSSAWKWLASSGRRKHGLLRDGCPGFSGESKHDSSEKPTRPTIAPVQGQSCDGRAAMNLRAISMHSIGSCPRVRRRGIDRWQVTARLSAARIYAALHPLAMTRPAVGNESAGSGRRGRRRIDPGLFSGSIVGWVGISGKSCVDLPEIPGHPSRKRPCLRRPELADSFPTAGLHGTETTRCLCNCDAP